MGKMKQLLTDFYEFEEEILTLLNMVKDNMHGSFILFFNEDVQTETIENTLSYFTIDQNLIRLCVFAIEMDIVCCNEDQSGELILSLKIPHMKLTVETD